VQQLLEARCQLRIDLPPWTLSETEQFIQQSIARAGGNPLIFSDQAIVRLHERSGGIPRQLIQLCEVTLLVGAAMSVNAVEPNLVDQAAEEISIPQAEELWGVIG
jgi:general secretion pathway protein A